jgi:ATP-dependent Clp protease ATP-binding subunit ClpB
MRIDKLTTKFQEALADAQSLAVGQDNPYIEPACHILSALLKPDRRLDQFAVAARRRQLVTRAERPSYPAGLNAERCRQPGQVQISRDTTALLNRRTRTPRKRGDEFIASEMFLLASPTTRARPAAS